MEAYSEIPMSEYWRIIRKRRWTILFVFIVVVVSAWMFTSLQAPVYQAAVELKIESSVPLGADLKSLKGMGGNEPDLGTELRLLKSLNILDKVVEKTEVLPVDPEERTRALHAVSLDYQNRISVEQIPDTAIIVIRASARSPEKAQILASAVADVYITENTYGRRRQLDSVLKYIDSQLAEYAGKIEEAENQLLKFKQDEKVFEVTPLVKANLDRMTVERTFDFEAQMLQADEEIKAVDALVEQRETAGSVNFFSSEKLADNFIFNIRSISKPPDKISIDPFNAP